MRKIKSFLKKAKNVIQSFGRDESGTQAIEVIILVLLSVFFMGIIILLIFGWAENMDTTSSVSQGEGRDVLVIPQFYWFGGF